MPQCHQGPARIEAHFSIAFLAYCLRVSLGLCLTLLAQGLTSRSDQAKFAAMQMIDVHMPTTDGRKRSLTRYTQPEPELTLSLERLQRTLSAQPPPKITSTQVAATSLDRKDLLESTLDSSGT